MIGDKTRLRLTNGYSINFTQIARMLVTACADIRQRIPPHDLAADLGISDNHAEFVCRIADAMGLLAPMSYRPTTLGSLVHDHDLFADDAGTLWYLHYVAASNEQNTVWYRLFSCLLADQRSFTRDDFRELFTDLRSQFTESSFRPYLNKESKSLLDAYTIQNFGRLALILKDGEQFILGYREPVPPLVLAACITRFRDRHRPGDTALSVTDILTAPNGPGVVCQIPEDRLRTGLEALKTQPGLSLESRADLDQVRLTDATQDYQWMERYYLSRQ